MQIKEIQVRSGRTVLAVLKQDVDDDNPRWTNPEDNTTFSSTDVDYLNFVVSDADCDGWAYIGDDWYDDLTVLVVR